MDIDPLLARVKAILLHPAREWPRIADEADTPVGIYRRHVLPLAALPPLFGFVRASLIGRHTLGMVLRAPLVDGLWHMILGYLANLVMVYMVAQVMLALAPTFEGRKDNLQALKLVAYAWTPAWIAGIAAVLPAWLGQPIGLAGLAYAVYLLYLGLPYTMHNPRERSLGYTTTGAVLAVLLTWIVAALLAAISLRTPMSESAPGHARPPPAASSRAGGSGPGASTLDPARLRALLPAGLDGFQRVSAQARRQQVMGMRFSQATAVYRGKDHREIDLEITDAAGAGALLGLSGEAPGNTQSANDNGFDKLRHAGDRILHSTWNARESAANTRCCLGTVSRCAPAATSRHSPNWNVPSTPSTWTHWASSGAPAARTESPPVPSCGGGIAYNRYIHQLHRPCPTGNPACSTTNPPTDPPTTAGS